MKLFAASVFTLSGLCALLILASPAGAVVISGTEVWNRTSNPHEADGVTLVDGVFTIPDGLQFDPGAEIQVWDHTQDFNMNPFGESLTFLFPAGTGGISFAADSGFDTMIGSRGSGGNLTFEMNDNGFAGLAPGDGYIVNCVGAGTCGPVTGLGDSAGGMNVVINSLTDVSLGAMITSSPDAGGGRIDIMALGAVMIDTVRTADTAAGGNDSHDINITAQAITLGDIDTGTRRIGNPDDGRRNGNITLVGLDPPSFDPNNAAGNTAAENIVTLTGAINTVGGRPEWVQGDLNIYAAKVVLESGFTATINGDTNVMTGVVGLGFTEADLFMDMAGSGLGASFVVLHDGLVPEPTTLGIAAVMLLGLFGSSRCRRR